MGGHKNLSLHSVAVSTLPFHGGSRGSNPLGDAKFVKAKLPNNVYISYYVIKSNF